MKKLIATVMAFLLTCSIVFAEEAKKSNDSESSKDSSSGTSFFNDGKNKLTAEVYVGALGFSFNQAVIYDRMFSENFGVGLGLSASESAWTDFGLFADIRFAKKWSAGLGATFNLNSDADLVGLLMRAAYHGDKWQWGPGKAGFLLGADWHLFSFEGSDDNATGLLYFLPRFMFGVNWQLDF